MSVAKLVKWGNSVGIRIPAHDLAAANAHIGQQFEVIVNTKTGGFVLQPIQNEQAGWLEAFNAAAKSNQDNLLIENIENDFDKDEWEW